ncbi:response regulator [Pseudomonas sp. B21-015]|uniref:response regulator n=1 Tax=Pseudomonas sp. B21-015 TaxID=2895473 RepID=UPI002160633D|nr:response regulator [Pseudomonas sp. B21-015]UVM51570.1 response regulator [Pseudomonas sp. B21-015]
MKPVLIIEDDSFKANSLTEHIEHVVTGANITIATNLADAIEMVNKNTYTLIIVDMAIPSHPTVYGGGSPMSLLTGGLDILLELRELERDDPCIIVTQYPDIEICGDFYPLSKAKDEIKKLLDCDVVTCIAYSEGSTEWKVAITEELNKI